MAYQKITANRAFEIIKSDTTLLPDISWKSQQANGNSWLARAGSTNLVLELEDDNGDDADITGVEIGYVVVNETSPATATITKIQASGLITVGNSLSVTAGDSIAIYKPQTQGAIIVPSVSSGSFIDIKVKTAGGDEVVFKRCAAGQVLPINVVQVFNTDTGANFTGVALW